MVLKKETTIAMLFVVVIVTLCACNRPETFGDVFDPETDYQFYFHEQGDSPKIAASETGYYFLVGNHIYYADKSDLKPVLLDSNPNNRCLSGDDEVENCNAYVNRGTHSGFLGFYKGKLYTVQKDVSVEEFNRGYELIEIARDGSRRRKILSFEFPPKSIAVHRGSVYFVSRDYSKQSELSYKLMKADLKGSKNASVIYEGDLENGDIQDIIAYKDHLYFTETGFNIVRIYRYDLLNGTVTRLFTTDDRIYPSLNGIFGGKLLFSYFNGNIDDPESWVQYAADLDGSRIETLPIRRSLI